MNIKVYDFIKSPLIILVGVLLFIITYNIKEENFIDKIMIPFALFVSILIILGGLIILSPFKRKISKILNMLTMRKMNYQIQNFFKIQILF